MVSRIIDFLAFIGLLLAAAVIYWLFDLLPEKKYKKILKEFANKNKLQFYEIEKKDNFDNRQDLIKTSFYIEGIYKNTKIRCESFNHLFVGGPLSVRSDIQFTRIIITKKHSLSLQIGPNYPLYSLIIFQDEIKTEGIPKSIILRGKSQVSLQKLNEIEHYADEYNLRKKFIDDPVWEPFIIFLPDRIEVRCPYLITDKEKFKNFLDATIDLIDKIV